MSDRSVFIRARVWWVFSFGFGLLLMGGCDAVPGLQEDLSRPTVSDLQVITDTVEVVEQDSVAEVGITIAARAVDADGTIERVVFTLEPASNPRGTASGELEVVDGALYGGGIRFTVPLREEIYTVRVFAVDDDGLASNQVTSQFRFDPTAHTSATTSVSGVTRSTRTLTQQW